MSELEQVINKKIKKIENQTEVYILFAKGDEKEANRLITKNKLEFDKDLYLYDYYFYCSKKYISMGKRKPYEVEITKIKENPDTTREFIDFIKKQQERKIKDLKKFLEENEDEIVIKELKELEEIREKIEELKEREKEIEIKYMSFARI